MAVFIIGTLDTKGTEVAWLREYLSQRGVECAIVDAGCQGTATTPADVTREQVFEAAGTTLPIVQEAADRGRAVSLAAEGVRRLLKAASAESEVDGVIAIGGSAGTTIGTAAMRELPLSVPKVMVSTMASGDTRPYVGGRNILMLNSVVDFAGINRISRLILTQAANALLGMLQPTEGRFSDATALKGERPLIAATMFGVTTPCVTHAKSILEAAGYEVVVFHATGNGGEAMEGLIRDGVFVGVLDLTTTELADELVGGVLSAGPNRLTAAADMAIPQVISVGATDMVNFGARDTVPDRFHDRLLYQHNASVTLMRTSMDECEAIGAEIGRKASRCKGPVSVFFPSLGVSAIDVDGQPFDNWAARMAIWAGLQSQCSDNVELKLLKNKINDEAFATAAAHRLLEMLQPSNLPTVTNDKT